MSTRHTTGTSGIPAGLPGATRSTATGRSTFSSGKSLLDTTAVTDTPPMTTTTGTPGTTDTTGPGLSTKDMLAAAFGHTTHATRPLLVAELHVDHPVQRGLNRRRATQMFTVIGGYNQALAGPLDVSQRSDGTYWVMDGQHRLEVAKLAGKTQVVCEVYRGLTRDQENLFFRLKNDTRLRVRSTALELWWSAFEGHDPAVLEQAGIIGSYGYEVAHSGSRESMKTGTNVIAAIGAIQEMYTKGGPEWLRRVLGFLSDVFPDDKDAIRNEMLQGSFDFLREFGDQVRYDQLCYKLRLVTATKLLAEANNISEYSARRTRVAEWLRRAYNKGRRPGGSMMLERRRTFGSGSRFITTTADLNPDGEGGMPEDTLLAPGLGAGLGSGGVESRTVRG